MNTEDSQDIVPDIGIIIYETLNARKREINCFIYLLWFSLQALSNDNSYTSVPGADIPQVRIPRQSRLVAVSVRGAPAGLDVLQRARRRARPPVAAY